MNALVNEWFVEYGSIDKASAEAVQLNGLACTPAEPSVRDSANAALRANKCFFMGIIL